MARTPTWQEDLQAQAAPQMARAAEELAAADFCVTHGYPVNDAPPPGTGGFRVDLAAHRPVPESRASLHVLVQFAPQAPPPGWFLIPDPNPRNTPGRPQNALLGVDAFSPKPLDPHPQGEFSRSLEPALFAAVPGDPHGPGIHQDRLQFALPRLLAETAAARLTRHPGESAPFFLATVLVTDARLWLLRKEAGPRDVADARNPEDIAREVDAAFLFREAGPGFRSFCRETFRPLYEKELYEAFVKVVSLKEGAGGGVAAEGSLGLLEGLCKGAPETMARAFSGITLSRADHLPRLLEALVGAAAKSAGGAGP